MPGEFHLPIATLYGFLLVLARIAGVFTLVPIPGFKQAPSIPRIVLAAGLTFALIPVWPSVAETEVGPGLLVLWMIDELAFGAAISVAVAFLNETFVLSSQIFGLQAGFGYASTIDPTTEADSSVLQIMTHLVFGSLFFTLGLDGQIIRIVAQSLQAYPPGTYLLTVASGEQVLKLGTVMFSTAVRFALPLIALLVLVDLSLALLGRINSQLQLLTLAFPIRMLVSVGLLAALTVVLPTLYRGAAEPTVRVLRTVLLPVR